MSRIQTYSGALTAEQFLFYEIRIASRFYLDGVSLEEAAAEIQEQNLFQYPTEREVKRMTRACYKRLEALDNPELIRELSSAPAAVSYTHLDVYKRQGCGGPQRTGESGRPCFSEHRQDQFHSAPRGDRRNTEAGLWLVSQPQKNNDTADRKIH